MVQPSRDDESLPLELSQQADGCWVVPLRVQPKARQDAILGSHDGALKVAVTAPPDKGKANAAVCKLLAKRLGIATAQVTLLTGATSRTKKVAIAIGTTDAATLCEALLPDPDD